MKLHFTKMHGCGNDYIYFECFNQEIENPKELSIYLSDRHFGIGGDGIILILPSKKADAQMRIFNADGSEAKMCGNGIRCVGQYLYTHHMVEGSLLKIDTLSGIKEVQLLPKKQEKNQVGVHMGSPILAPVFIPVDLEGDFVIGKEVKIGNKNYSITCVSMGNPHCIIFEKEIDKLNLQEIGPLFEKSVLFPNQVNTEFIEIVDSHTLRMRVWERGSGETLACGTGACASVVAAVLNGYCKKNEMILVKLKGGELKITYTDEGVYMIGDAETIFEGVIEI